MALWRSEVIEVPSLRRGLPGGSIVENVVILLSEGFPNLLVLRIKRHVGFQLSLVEVNQALRTWSSGRGVRRRPSVCWAATTWSPSPGSGVSHWLLSIQVTAEVERVSKEKEPVRREVPGLGEEVKEDEPTPAFPGLELSVQLRLVEMLETAVKIWRTRRFSPSEWFSAKTICQFQLSAAFSLQLLGHSDLVQSVFRTVLETARDNDAWEEEALLAQVELAEVGEEVDLVQVLELGEALSEKKAGSVSPTWSGGTGSGRPRSSCTR